MSTSLKDTMGLKGKVRYTITDSITNEIIHESPFFHNLVVDGTDTGFNLILDRLNADNTYSLNITHLDIGTNATTPAFSDTVALSGAVARTDKATGVVSGSSITFKFFFASAELADGTYQDVRMVVDGTASLGTGKLFCRSLFGTPLVKGTNQNITLEWVLTKA